MHGQQNTHIKSNPLRINEHLSEWEENVRKRKWWKQDKTECEAHFEVQADERKLPLTSDTKNVHK